MSGLSDVVHPEPGFLALIQDMIDASVGGSGAVPLRLVQVAFDHTTPGYSGTVIGSLAPGEIVFGYATTVSVAFDGTTPKINVAVADYNSTITTEDVSYANVPIGNGVSNAHPAGTGGLPFTPTTVAQDIIIYLNDGSGGAAGSTVGEGVFSLLILPAIPV